MQSMIKHACDISGKSIIEIYDNSLFKKWIKLINIDQTILLNEYKRKDHFIPIAEVVLDDEVFTTRSRQGEKKRTTMIKFIPKIPEKEFNQKVEWLYVFVINERIVKIGGTRTGLKGRVNSYLCGHHTTERNKSGHCSNTNAFIYNTFEFYLNLGCKIQMFGYKLPITKITIEIFGKYTDVVAQTYHAYESTFLEDYRKIHGNYPILSNNCDPEYKE